jgi:hypothetical protein
MYFLLQVASVGSVIVVSIIAAIDENIQLSVFLVIVSLFKGLIGCAVSIFSEALTKQTGRMRSFLNQIGFERPSRTKPIGNNCVFGKNLIFMQVNDM